MRFLHKRRFSAAAALGPAFRPALTLILPAVLPAALALALAAFAARPAKALQITVVNMIPNSQSSEAHEDSEPNLAVDPAHPLRMAATAFTPYPADPSQAAIYLSTDGGATWTLKPVLPASKPGMGHCPNSFCDVTLRFAGTSGRLYVSDLTQDAQTTVTLRVSRFDDIFSGPATPINLEKRGGSIPATPDQPYIQATTVLGGEGTANDRVFVGVNDARMQVAPKTATVDVDVHANASPPSLADYSVVPIEARPAQERDGSAVRTAVHAGGTVYAAFYGVRPPPVNGADIVVVRDDHWGKGPQAFTDLKGADSLAGIAVTHISSYSPVESKLGSQRVGRSQISLAVDPNDASSVWLAWGEGSGASFTLHLRHSSNSGNSWGGGDLRQVVGATNPALAVNSSGKVGFLYQQAFFNGAFWLWTTALEISEDSFATQPQPIVLNKTIQESAQKTDDNPFGDYEHLMAVGKDFFGVFSADNTPDLSNFPQGAPTYQREHDFATQKLFADASHSPAATVGSSIDPFFFHVSEEPPFGDYFVRDWTDASGHDPGLEPSTHSIFYTTSDVWNRVTDTAGALSTASAPPHQDPQDAMGGQNFAYVRVGRKGISPAGDQQVTAHFLYSNFGAGMAYKLEGGEAALDFPSGQTEVALADGQGFSWLLPPDHSTHICMAVEITAPGDPFALPDLKDNVPGWPTLDTAVLYDNNKAQRNIIYPMGKHHTKVHYYALARNAATFQRDLFLRLDAPVEVIRRFGPIDVDACGAKTVQYRPGNVLTIPAMAPGEVRAVRVSIPLLAAAPGLELPLTFTEVTDPGPAGKARDGFAIAPVPTTVEEAARYDLVFERAVLTRAGIIDNDATAAALAAKTRDLLLSDPAISAAKYVAFLKQQAPLLGQVVAALPRPPFACNMSPALDLEHLLSALGAGDPGAVSAAHSDFLQSVDTVLTLHQLAAAP